MSAAAATAARPALGALTYNDVTHTYVYDGRRCRSVTNIAKIPTDTYTVDQWRLRQVALGLALDPTLVEDIAAHRDDNHRLNDIAQKAMDLAGASNASRRGTQAHAASEYHDLHQPLITAQQERDATVWQRTLDAYGISIDPRYVEQVVLYPDDAVAGRIDRFARMDGYLFDFDIKTGTSAWRYPHSTAVQLALHVAAPYMQANSRIVDGLETITEWQPVPGELRRDIAYVIAMPTRDDDELGTLYRFTLQGKFAGEIAARVAIIARHFQMNDNLCTRVNPPMRPAEIAAVLPVKASFDATAPNAQEWLVERIHGLGDNDKALLRGRWQATGLPSILTVLTPEQLVEAWVLVDGVDAFMEHAPPPPVETTTMADVRRLFPKPADGDIAPDESVRTVADAYSKMPESVIVRIGDLSGEATRNGVDFHLGTRATVRRLELLRGLVELAVNDCADDATLRNIVAGVTGDYIDERSPAGALVGSLDVEQAATFAHIAAQWVLGRVTLTADAEGRVVLATDNPKE